MNQYGDEAFIQVLRETQENAKNTNIREGSVWAGDKELLFEEHEIWKGQLWMWLPKDFGILNEKYTQMKYPSGRLDVIYSNKETTINISFMYKQEKLEPGEEKEICGYLGQIVRNLYPTGDVLGESCVQAGENEVACVEFVTPAMDGTIYNMMFVTSLKGRMILGTCNCLKEDQEDWRDLFVQMLETIRTA